MQKLPYDVRAVTGSYSLTEIAVSLAQIDVPATIMYATGKEGCGVRKPETGMWDFFVARLNCGVQPGKRSRPSCMPVKPHCLACVALPCTVLCWQMKHSCRQHAPRTRSVTFAGIK